MLWSKSGNNFPAGLFFKLRGLSSQILCFSSSSTLFHIFAYSFPSSLPSWLSYSMFASCYLPPTHNQSQQTLLIFLNSLVYMHKNSYITCFFRILDIPQHKIMLGPDIWCIYIYIHKIKYFVLHVVVNFTKI